MTNLSSIIPKKPTTEKGGYMKLREIIEQLTGKNSSGLRLFTQETLAEKLATNQSAVSQMKAGATWEEHWQIFMRLLPLSIEYGLIGERELLGDTGHDKKRTQSSHRPDKTEKDQISRKRPAPS
jgi:hypothetical protein